MEFRILAASSSLSRRLWYRNELERRGCQIQTASSGLECLANARSFEPHALLLESFLPWGGSDGVLAVKESEPLLRAIPVVVIDTERNAAQTYRLGAYELAGYWTYRPTAEELIRMVRTAVEHQQARSGVLSRPQRGMNLLEVSGIHGLLR